jgi:hypothetical protein
MQVSSGPADSIPAPASLSHSEDTTNDGSHGPLRVHVHANGVVSENGNCVTPPASSSTSREFTIEHDTHVLERSDLQPLLPGSCELDFDLDDCGPLVSSSWAADSSSTSSFRNGAIDRLIHHRHSDPLV